MMTNSDQKKTENNILANQPKIEKPNDQGSVGISSFVRIFDPKTKEVYVETRA
jgi:hypothetical protein